MKRENKPIQKILFLLFVSLTLINISQGQVLLTKGGVPYTQDFNTLASTGTSHSWANNATIQGWYVTYGTSFASTYQVGNGSSSASNVYSFGSTGSTDRAFGAIANSTSSTTRFGVRFVNNTGKQITSFRISYRGEQWYQGTATSPTGSAATMDFSYKVGTNLTDPSDSQYTTVSALNFSAPNLPGIESALDGNAAGNYTNKTATVNVNVNNGQEIMMRWEKFGASNSHGLALDDLVVIPITNEPLVICSQTSLSFEDTELGSNSMLSLSVERLNLTGTPTLTMQSGAASVFSVTPATLPQANGTTTVNVTFIPTTEITYNDILIISGGGLEEPTHIALNGTGIMTGTPGPNLIVSPTSLTFPATLKGATSASQNVTVAVDASTTHNITYSLNDNENFNLNATGFNAATGGIIAVSFTPKSYNSPKTAQLTISSGELSETVTLTGTVPAPTLASIPTTIYIANGSAHIPIIASNLGDPITITSSNPNFTPSVATLPITTTNGAVDITFTGTADESTTITISTLAATTLERTVTVYGKANLVAGWNFQTEADLNANHGTVFNQGVLFSKSANNTGILGFEAATAHTYTFNWGIDQYWQTDAIRTTGFKDLTVQSKQFSQMQGPRDWKIQYKIGDGVWTDVSDATIQVTDFSLTPYGPFTLPAACNNVNELYLRWIITSNTNPLGGNIAASQTSGISEVFVKGIEDNTIPTTTYTVTISSPANGTFSVMNGSTPVTSGTDLEEGTVLTLTATPNTGYEFEKWWDNNTNPTRNHVLVSDVTISATFTQIPATPQTHTVDYSMGDQDSWEYWMQIPIYGAFMGAYSSWETPPWQRPVHHTQTVYTANKIQPLVGSQISKIAYRVRNNAPASYDWQATGTIKIAQTSATNVYSDFLNIESLSSVAVCYGEFKYQNHIMEFEFDPPFIYQGGSIVVDITKTPGTGVDYGVSFMGGATCFADDPNNQAWMNNPDNFVSRHHYDINSSETALASYHRFPEITFTYLPFDNHIITATASAGGTISPSGSVAVAVGADQTFTFIPNEGYQISNVLVNSVPNPGAVSAGSYTFTNVTSAQTIHVSFTRIKYTITASVLGTGGVIDPEGAVQVNHGEDETFYFFPVPPNVTTQVLIDGQPNPQAVNAGYYAFTNVTADHTIQVSFSTVDYIITPSVISGNGTITPANPVGINQGGSQRFDFTPNIDSYINEVLVDNTSEPDAVTNGYYTFNNVSANHTIGVAFAMKTFTITASVNGGNGTITPDGTTTLNYGSSQSYTIVANNNYKISKLLIDNIEQPNALNEESYFYTFSNITENHTIEVFFQLTYTITASVNGSNGGTITPDGKIMVLSGESKTFTMIPNIGYEISQVLIDAVSDPIAANTGTYTFTNVSANHTIEVFFIKKDNILIVNDETNINASIPISTAYMDCEQHTQTIYPEELLQTIIGKNIKSISYHTDALTEDFGGARGTVRLMRTFANNLTSGFEDSFQATEVYTGPIIISNYLLTFTFTTPFVYTGGNLLIDITTDVGEPKNVLFYGTTASDLSRFSFTFEGIFYNQTHAATPKTAFQYESVVIPYHTVTINQQEDGTIDVEDITNGGIIQSGASVAQGTELEISVAAHENYVFQSIVINNEVYSQTSPAIFTMGNEDIVISAVISVGVNKYAISDVNVYAQQDRVYIVNKNNINLKSIQVIDLLGRVIYETSANTSTVFSVEAATGHYIVRLISEDEKLTTTKIHLSK